MSFLFGRASVNAEDVEAFRESVYNFSEYGEREIRALADSLEEMWEIAEANAKRLEELYETYGGMYLSAKTLQGDLEHSVSFLQSELSRTPRTLQEKSRDSKGNERVTEKPNPEHAQTAERLRRERAKLHTAKELAYKIYDKQSYIRSLADQVRSAANQIPGLYSEFRRDSRQLILKTEQAYRSLERCLSAIDAYTEFRFRMK